MTQVQITVYIVDDDASVRQALARLVQSAGMQTQVFETVPELIGLEHLAAPACVIADIQMPEVSGLELLGRLAEQGHRLPVIFVTAYDNAQNRAVAKRVGAVGYFRKPVDGEALLDAIAWAVDAPGDARDV